MMEVEFGGGQAEQVIARDPWSKKMTTSRVLERGVRENKHYSQQEDEIQMSYTCKNAPLWPVTLQAGQKLENLTTRNRPTRRKEAHTDATDPWHWGRTVAA